MRICLTPLVVVLVGCAAESESVSNLLSSDDAHSGAIAELDRRIDAARALAGNDWTVDARAAALHLQRARLAGGYDDYDAAEAHLDAAFSLAVEGGGPHEVRADVLASLHRVDEAQADVARARDRILLDDRTAARLDLLDAQLAWSAGQHTDAAQAVIANEEASPTFGSAVTLGNHRWHVLDDEGATQAFDLAEDRIIGEAPVLRSWLHLQRGIHDLDRDRLDEALEHYLDADAALPGWWLVQEHVAEILVLTDRPDQAELIYLDVVERTDAPEFMDALAGLALDRGDQALAAEWIARGESAYEEQLRRHPEAAAGHALDHYLDFGPADRALELARANVAVRPNAEAHVKLALALHNSGDVQAAVEALEAARATPWRNSDFYDVAEVVYPAAGLDVPESRPW